MISNQEPLRNGTAMNLGLISTEDGTRSYILTIVFRVNECEKFKLDNKHHDGAHSLPLPKMMVNALCHSSSCNKPMSTTKISTIISHWTG